jgi:hypothetical protein
MKYEELGRQYQHGMDYLKAEIQKLEVEDYIKGNVNLRRMASAHTVRDLPIRVLDSIIQTEENCANKPATFFNRGENLKKSLIDKTKVKNFVDSQ